MAYSTLADIKNQLSEDQLIELTSDDSWRKVKQPVIDRAIADADADIDSYLASQYPVPLSPVPQLVLKFSVDIAIYNLYSRRMGASEARELRYQDAIKHLKLLAVGTATLGETPQRAQSQSGGPKAVSKARTMTTGSGTVSGTLDNY